MYVDVCAGGHQMREMSEQVRKVSCGPQPKVPVPFAHKPQEFPETTTHSFMGVEHESYASANSIRVIK